jgi:hypothetical protein
MLEESPDQDLQKKIRIFYAPQFFSGQNRKKVRKLRQQIRYIYTVKPVLNGFTRDQNIFPLKPGFHLIKAHYISKLKIKQINQRTTKEKEIEPDLTFQILLK